MGMVAIVSDMNRIERIFADLRAAGKHALMPFITAGYPNLAATEAMLPQLQAAGASVCELGIPFSDPVADGPVISASMTEALEAGVQPAGVFELVARQRDTLDIGLVAMLSYSIVYRIGVESFVRQAADAGIDGLIIPDLPLEEADAVTGPAKAAQLTCSGLIAPTTPRDRAEQIARACTGFIYLIARTGLTGERDSVPVDLRQRVDELRRVSDLPIAVGFGISRADHVRAVTQVADAAIVGSAVVKQIGQHLDEPPAQLAEHIGRFIAELAGGLS
jgi:tryptophan synthase alpha chain